MDYVETYQRIARRLRPYASWLAQLDRALVVLVAAVFVVALLVLWAAGDARVWRIAAVCAIGFALCTGLRAAIDAPRPYEGRPATGDAPAIPPITPVVPKATRGKSFPSRHVFSATIIACSFAWVSAPLGAVAFTVAALIAVLRVACGNHYPRDVLAAIGLALLCGFAGFVLVA